ncbi:unnamed protein product [Peniophora sp. CBMAI 1063]|nr:unnamed protein product [Peniophora sp. CBMAI 1063]
MSLIVNQHYGSQAVIRNHYHNYRTHQPDPYPHGSRPQKRTWSMHTFPNATHPAYPLAARAPFYTPWPIANPPAPIIINNCACARSSPINVNAPAPDLRLAQPTEAIQFDSGATAPLRYPEVRGSVEPATTTVVPPGAFHEAAIGVRARDILPTVRPPRGPRVETPPPSPPPRRSTRYKAAYDDAHCLASSGPIAAHRYSADEGHEAPAVNQDYGSRYENTEYGTSRVKPHIRGAHFGDAARPARSVNGPERLTPPPSPRRGPPSHPTPFSAGGLAIPGSPGHTPFIQSMAIDESVGTPHSRAGIDRKGREGDELLGSRAVRTDGGFTPNFNFLRQSRCAAAHQPTVPQCTEHHSYSPLNIAHKSPFETQAG